MSAHSNEVFSYWHSLRHSQAAPCRQDFQPSALGRRLPDLFILGWTETELRFRLAGTRICELFNEELRYSQFERLFKPSSRDRIMEAALNAFRTEDAILIDIVVQEGNEFLPFEMLLMPLRSPNGVCDRLLGGLFSAHHKSIRRSLSGGEFIFRGWIPCDTPSQSNPCNVDALLRQKFLANTARPHQAHPSFAATFKALPHR